MRLCFSSIPAGTHLRNKIAFPLRNQKRSNLVMYNALHNQLRLQKADSLTLRSGRERETLQGALPFTSSSLEERTLSVVCCILLALGLQSFFFFFSFIFLLLSVTSSDTNSTSVIKKDPKQSYLGRGHLEDPGDSGSCTTVGSYKNTLLLHSVIEV